MKAVILTVHECISADRNLHVRLLYHDLVILLHNGFDMKITVPLLNLIYLKTFSPI